MAKVPPKPYQGVFENMDFPAYKYEHYPLMMTKRDEKDAVVDTRIVNDAIEEEIAVQAGFVAPKGVGPTMVLTTNEVEELRREAEENFDLAQAAKKVALEKDARVQELELELAKFREANGIKATAGKAAGKPPYPPPDPPPAGSAKP